MKPGGGGGVSHRPGNGIKSLEEEALGTGGPQGQPPSALGLPALDSVQGGDLLPVVMWQQLCWGSWGPGGPPCPATTTQAPVSQSGGALTT